jgi:phosphatidate cytidylyltransferase
MGHFGVSFEVNYLWLVLMGIVCGVLGIVGDLSASLIKRQFGIKDFGNIMPGHGGLMDRFDSVLFVAPFMMFTLSHITLFS